MALFIVRHNSTYNDENLVDDNISCQPLPVAVNLSHTLNFNQMSSADISYQRNQQNPENKSYTSIPDNKQSHFLGKRKQNRPSYPNPQLQRPAIQYYTGMPLYQHCTDSFAPIAKFRNKRVQRLSP
jgi:hypothetical protein